MHIGDTPYARVPLAARRVDLMIFRLLDVTRTDDRGHEAYATRIDKACVDRAATEGVSRPI